MRTTDDVLDCHVKCSVRFLKCALKVPRYFHADRSVFIFLCIYYFILMYYFDISFWGRIGAMSQSVN